MAYRPSSLASVSEPRAVATGSRSPAGFLKVPPDPIATARGSDTKPIQKPEFIGTKPLG